MSWTSIDTSTEDERTERARVNAKYPHGRMTRVWFGPELAQYKRPQTIMPW